jgi:hypothetical protein
MLTIRAAQFAVFSQVEMGKFEDWTLAHLRKFFPDQCAALGEPELREWIRYGIWRAAHHGVTAKRDVCKYLDLMIVFGRDFDKRWGWAGDILRRGGNSGARMQNLLRAAKQHLKNR